MSSASLSWVELVWLLWMDKCVSVCLYTWRTQ